MRKLIVIIALALSFPTFAQEKIEITEEDYQNQEVEMADAFRKDGKIYVVVAVMSIILGGLIFYTVRLDRKLSRLENDTKLN